MRSTFSLPGIVALITLVAALTAGAEEVRDEYSVKVAYLYNFARFVKWPDSAFPDDRFNFCVLGENPFGALLQPLENRKVESKQIIVKGVELGTVASARCHLLFVRNSRSYTQLLEQLGGTPVLTVSETEGPVIISLYNDEGRVKFHIDRERAKAASLQISAQLMKLATPD